MANFVFNRISLSGDANQIKALKKHVKTKNSNFDFDKIVPMPTELAIEDSEFDAREYLEKYKNAPLRECINENLDQSIRYFLYEKECAGHQMTLAHINNTIQMVHNYFKYGYTHWYDWKINHWGTKWNTDDVSADGNNFGFNTAWNTPRLVLIELSKQYPAVEIIVEYADEDLGYNCGVYKILNGIIDEDAFSGGEDALQFACNLWGFDYEEAKLMREQT